MRRVGNWEGSPLTPLDPITFGAAAGLLAAIAVAACAGPALSAARSDAAVSLRDE
jgi:hypothetical protein